MDMHDQIKQDCTVKDAFKQLMQIWQHRLPSLLLGLSFSLVALALGLGLMSFAGGRIALTALGMVIVSSILLKLLGGGRLIMRYVERLYTHNAMFKALADLRIWFFQKLANGAAAGLGFRHSGDVLSRLVSDIEVLDGLYLRLILPFAGSMLTFCILALAIGMLNMALSICIAILYAFSGFICPILSALITRKRGRFLIQGIARLRIQTVDFIHGMKEIKAFGAEKRILDVMEAKERELYQQQEDQSKAVSLISLVAFLCNRMAILCVLMASLHIGFDGIDAFHGVFCLFLVIAAFETVVPLSKAGGLAGQIMNAAVRIIDINRNYEHVKETATVAPLQGDICFKDISFRWNTESPWLYQSLNLTVVQGESVAIVGASGAGKSTLAAMLLKVVAPQQGVITFGGIDISALNTDSLRKRIAWLSQNTHLFDDTIRQNLLLGNPEATDEELWQALSEAAIADVVKKMPDGLDTWLGEGGVKVSGGQGRRIALARTLLFKAPVLLLDEPTTGLDSETETEFFQTLNHVAVNRTVILIVHRLTGVEKVNRVWNLADGQFISDC